MSYRQYYTRGPVSEMHTFAAHIHRYSQTHRVFGATQPLYSRFSLYGISAQKEEVQRERERKKRKPGEKLKHARN